MGNNQKLKFLKAHGKQQQIASRAVNNRYPKFSFEFCFSSNRGINNCDKKSKLAVIEKITHLSQMTWQDIKGLAREQGIEKIEVSSFKFLPQVPKRFQDEDKVAVFRLPSSVGRLMGYIQEDTFFIVWIDTKFDMYKH